MFLDIMVELIQYGSIESLMGEPEIPVHVVELLMSKKEPFDVRFGNDFRESKMFCMYFGSGSYDDGIEVDHFVWMSDFLGHEYGSIPKIDATFRVDRKNLRILAEPGIGGLSGRDSYRVEDTYLSSFDMGETLKILDLEGFTFHQITRFRDFEFVKNLEGLKGALISSNLQQYFQKKTGMHSFEAYMLEKDMPLKDVLSGNYKEKTVPYNIDNAFIKAVQKDW
jgi:hypothetical protein